MKRFLCITMVFLTTWSLCVKAQNTKVIQKLGTDTSLVNLHTSMIISFVNEINEALKQGHYIVGQPSLHVYKQGSTYMGTLRVTLTRSENNFHTYIARRGSWWYGMNAQTQVDVLIAQQKALPEEGCNVDNVISASAPDVKDGPYLVCKEIFYKYYKGRKGSFDKAGIFYPRLFL